MTGEDSDFPIHLDGCHRLQKPQSNQGIDDTNSQVNSICHFLTLLARTTSCKPIQRPWHQGQSPFEEPYFHDDERSIEYIYGITPALGNLLQRTCHLAEYIAYYKDQEQNVPTILLSACRALKLDLLSWKLDSEEFHVIGPESTMIEIARCQAHAFHSAVLIFFYRTIGINCALNLDHEVQSILRNLTRAENLKDQYMGGEKRTAPMSWPAFVAACEATERGPWVEWWTRVQGYKVGNFKRQWLVIRELWGIMDEDMTVVSWRDALRKSGKLVLPI